MRSPSRVIVRLGLGLTLAASVWGLGCASLNPQTPAARPGVAADPAPPPQPVRPGYRVQLNDRPANDPDSIDFSGTPRAPRIDHAGAIGLYGELVSNTYAQRPSDGSDNIRQVTSIIEGAVFDPDINRDGTRIVIASTMHSRHPDLYLKSPEGSTFTQLTDDPADDVMPAFSPDGERIAFASNRTGDWNIYIMPASGGPATQLTFDLDHELHPTWSPDGRTLAYCRFGAVSSRWEIWTIDIDNPTVRRFLVYGMFPQWNPDPATSKLLFQRARQRGSRFHSIWTIDYIGGEAKRPTEIVSAANAGVINPCWSPDGRRIGFVTVVDPHEETDIRPSQCDLWIVGLDGANRVALTHGDHRNYQPAWSADGYLYFVSNRSGSENIWAVATDAAMGQSAQPGGQMANVETSSETSEIR